MFPSPSALARHGACASCGMRLGMGVSGLRPFGAGTSLTSLALRPVRLPIRVHSSECRMRSSPPFGNLT